MRRFLLMTFLVSVLWLGSSVSSEAQKNFGTARTAPPHYPTANGMTPRIASTKSIIWLTPDQVKRDNLSSNRPLLLFVTTQGCSYCVRMKSQTFGDQAIVRHITKNYTALNVDGVKHQQLSKNLGIRVFPTTVLIQPDGKVLDIVRGYQGPRDFAKKLQSADVKLARFRQGIASKPTAAAKK